MKNLKYFVLIPLLFMSSTSSANEALSKAQEAAFIQSGARDFIDKLQRYAISKLNAPKEMAIAGYAYQTYKTKSLSLPFNNKKVILTTNAVTLEWPI